MYTCYIADIRTSAVIYFVAEMRWWLALASVTSYKRFVQPSFLTTMSVIREVADGRSDKEPLMSLSRLTLIFGGLTSCNIFAIALFVTCFALGKWCFGGV